jgi:hypothetical protein
MSRSAQEVGSFDPAELLGVGPFSSSGDPRPAGAQLDRATSVRLGWRIARLPLRGRADALDQAAASARARAFDLRHGLKARLGASALLATPVCVRGTLRICRCASAPRSLKT